MGNVEEPERWHGDRDPFGPWPRGRFGHRHRGPFWMRRGNGGPLRRDPAERLAGGVAAGVAAWRGFNVTTVRIVFVLIALVTGGFGVPLYVAAWLLIPAAGEDASIGSRARSDSRGIALAAGLATVLAFLLFVVGVFNTGWPSSWAWPQVFTVAGLALIWRNASPEEQATLRRLAEPLGAAASPARPGRRSAIRLTVAGAADIRRRGLAGLGAREPGPAAAAGRGPTGDRRSGAAARAVVAADRPRPGAGTPGQGPGRGTARHGGPGARLGAADAGADPAARGRPAEGRPAGPAAGTRAAVLAVRGAGPADAT